MDDRELYQHLMEIKGMIAAVQEKLGMIKQQDEPEKK